MTGLLRDSLGYQGITFTDALEMKGVAKYFPGGTISVEALIAGNDMLCLPASVPESIMAIKKAIADKRLSWEDIDAKVKKVLLAKYNLGLHEWNPIDTAHLVDDVNAATNPIRYQAAAKTLTLLHSQSDSLSLSSVKRVAYVGIGTSQLNDFGQRLVGDWKADTYLFGYKEDARRITAIMDSIRNGHYDLVVTGIHDYSLRPANNYGISSSAISLFNQLQIFRTATFVFGNVFALSNFCSAKNLVACYQDDDITQQAAADLLSGKITASGTLPVSVCEFQYGEEYRQRPVFHAMINLMPWIRLPATRWPERPFQAVWYSPFTMDRLSITRHLGIIHLALRQL